MIQKSILNIIFFLFSLYYANSQEVVTGLQSNPLIKSAHISVTKSVAVDVVELPFFDDFSGQKIFPDSKKWADDFVFINDTYTDKQITVGVATFDALSNTGRLYETASSTGFEADHLTSQPVNINFPSTDNIWLSFYYQPGGLADMPEERDSLVLQFFAPDEAKWYSIWKAPTGSRNYFNTAIIRIDQPRFLKKEFRFRFINYASLSDLSDPSMVGNCDQWNIDYVFLDKNRNASDTIFSDVAFRYPLRSLLVTHEAMPWKQFRQIYLQEMGEVIPIHYRNNDTIVRNVTRNFEIRDVYNNKADFFSAGAKNIDPLTNFDGDIDLTITFSSDSEDSALFKVTSWLITDNFDPKENDTLKYFQVFSNYFAFDDGSAEGGYGINGQGSNNAMVAYRFKSFMQDTLRAVSICFNDSYMNANLRTFDLMVWDDNGGVPGNILASVKEVKVEQGEEINGFHTYILPDGVMVNNTFYVGWKQRSDSFLNAGFDINTPHEGRLLYWINGIWSVSGKTGSIMIRPVIGHPLITAINDVANKIKSDVNFWPNPANDFINFDPDEIPAYGLTYISIIDLQGKELLKVPLSEKIDISTLHEGIYFIITSRNGRRTGYNRLVKTK